MTAVDKLLEHQAEQIELLKQQLIDTGKDRDAQAAWVKRHEAHLDEVRTKLTLVWELLDSKKLETLRALDWLLIQADRDDYYVD